MSTFFSVAMAVVLLLVLGLHVLSLPANWLLLGGALLWKWLSPPPHGLDMWVFAMLVGLALLAEVLEFCVQLWGSKRYGGTGRGTLGGFIGGLLGAVLGAPFFFGLGALFGVLGGAYLGCFVMELGLGRSFDEAGKAAKGTFFGRFWGLSIKFGIGVWMWIVIVFRM